MRLRTIFLGNMLLLATPVADAAEIPVTGHHDRRLESLDRLMTGFLTRHKLPGASLAVTRHGRLVYARGFGLADTAADDPVSPTSLFRIASLSKPITAVAILQLVEQGRVSLDDSVSAVLGLEPTVDRKRHQRVTIRQCLQHTGGWDRGVSFDPMFQSVRIATVLGTKSPAAASDVIRFMQRWPLDFDPGTRYAYSNYGYCLLGRVIEKLSGTSYERHVRKQVFGPLGVTRVRVGRSQAQGRFPGEVRYHVDGEKVGLSVFASNLGQPVSRAYGAWYLEAMDSHGGWIASAVDLVRFASAMDRPQKSRLLKAVSIKEMIAAPPAPVSRESDGRPSDVYYGLGWSVRQVSKGRWNLWHTGSLAGTSTLLVRRHDGINWAVLFNSRKPCNGSNPSSAIDPLVHKAVDAVKEWPEKDQFDKLLSED